MIVVFLWREKKSQKERHERLRDQSASPKYPTTETEAAPAPGCFAHSYFLVGFSVQGKGAERQARAASQPYLLQLVGLGLVLVAVGVLAVGHAQAPHGQDAIDVIPYPGILLLMTG